MSSSLPNCGSIGAIWSIKAPEAGRAKAARCAWPRQVEAPANPSSASNTAVGYRNNSPKAACLAVRAWQSREGAQLAKPDDRSQGETIDAIVERRARRVVARNYELSRFRIDNDLRRYAQIAASNHHDPGVFCPALPKRRNGLVRG